MRDSRGVQAPATPRGTRVASGSRDPTRDSRGLQALFTLLCSAYAPFLSQDPMWDSRDLQSPFTLLCEFVFSRS